MNRRTTTLLSSVAIGTVAAALLFQAVSLYQSRVRALSLVATRAANRAQSTADGVETIFKRLDLALLAIRDKVDPEVVRSGIVPDSPESRAMHEELALWVRRVPEALRLHVVSASGAFVYSSMHELPPARVADRSYFRQCQQGGPDELHVTDSSRSRVVDQWAIYVTRCIATADGQFAGLVIAAVVAESLRQELTAVDQNEWFLAVLDRERKLVASNPPHADWLGKTMPDRFLEEGIALGRSAYRGRAFGFHSPQIWATRVSGRLPLMTVAAFPSERALVQWHKDFKVGLAVALLLISGCVLLLVVQRRNVRAAEAIRILHERMRLATTSVGLGIWEWRADSDSVTWDPETAALFGTTEGLAEVTREQWFRLLEPAEASRIRAALGSSDTRPFELRLRVKDAGSDTGIRHLRLKGVAQRDAEGRISGAIGVVWDDTRFERIQHQLEASEEYFRTLFDAVPHAVVVIESGRVIDSNRPYREMFAIDAAESTPPWLMAEERQPSGASTREAGDLFYRAVLGGQLRQLTWHCRRRDGAVFETEIRASLFRHEGRELVVATVRDMTEQRSMEERLHQAQKLDALGQLAGGVAHDFNNMLAAIMGAAELLSPSESPESQQELRETIVVAAGRAAQLTGKLLAFARKGKVLSAPVDVHQVIRDTGALLERTIDRLIATTYSLKATTAVVMGDASQLQSAILNLGVNARDAMPNGGALTLSTELVWLGDGETQLGAFRLPPGEYLTVEVADTGCGIAPEILDHVFDPFFTTKEVGKGTGLGLAAVFGTMASHRGAVTVESRVGHGSRFTLYLPLLKQATLLPAPKPQAMVKGSGAVLVVDDELLVRVATEKLLESLGYQGIGVSDPEEAIGIYRERRHELVGVVLDMVMPRLSGLELAQRLRAIDVTVPIVLVSGYPRTEQLDPWFGRAFDAFLQKPFTQLELGRTLAQLKRVDLPSDVARADLTIE